MKEPYFSIIIPTYNRAHIITKTLDSIRSQTFKSYEVIIVDDGSTDNSSIVINDYIKKNDLYNNWFYFKKENAERGAARNYGTKKANGKIINWFDSDDYAYPNHLQTAYNCFNEMKCEVAHFAFDVKDMNDNIIQKYNQFPRFANQILIKGNKLSCNNLFVLKVVALQLPFCEDKKLSASEDYQLWLKISARFPIFCINTITSSVIQHEQRSVNSMFKKNIIIERFLCLIKYSLADIEVVKYLGKKRNYWIMKHLLLLAVELAVNKHKKDALIFLMKSLPYSWRIFYQRSFYATLKHLIFK